MAAFKFRHQQQLVALWISVCPLSMRRTHSLSRQLPRFIHLWTRSQSHFVKHVTCHVSLLDVHGLSPRPIRPWSFLLNVLLFIVLVWEKNLTTGRWQHDLLSGGDEVWCLQSEALSAAVCHLTTFLCFCNSILPPLIWRWLMCRQMLQAPVRRRAPLI